MKFETNHIASFLFILIICGTSCQKEIANSQGNPVGVPDTVHKWSWEFLGKPLGDSEVNSITIHPEDDNLWFVTSWKGLYVTRDGGKNWKNYLSGFTPAIDIDRNNPSNIFVGSGNEIYLSKDYGQSWSLKYTFPKVIISILISQTDGSVYAGIAWEDSQMANGIYKSTDGGISWQYYSYDVSAKGLIPWDIEEDQVNKKIYIATEIYDHPQPYHPPFLRSSDGGKTWKDISGTLPWHVDKIQVHPVTHEVFALTEGAGLFYSKDFGDSWQSMSVPFWLDFIIDKNNPTKFFGGAHTYVSSPGGVFFSDHEGTDFRSIGLEGHIVGSLCLDRKSLSLYVASYNSGLFRAK